MHRNISRAVALGAVGLLALPGLALAGHHAKPKPMCPGEKVCYAWKLTEVEETVYEVKYRQETKKVKRPVIKEIKRPVSEKVCKPFSRTVLRECMVPEYKQSTEKVEKTVCQQITDECGNCQTVQEVVPELVTCLMKMMAPQMVPMLEWEMIPVEDVHYETYLVQEMEEVEVKVEVLVRVPKVIKRKVWTRVPTCAPCDCEPCTTCGQGCGKCSCQ